MKDQNWKKFILVISIVLATASFSTTRAFAAEDEVKTDDGAQSTTTVWGAVKKNGKFSYLGEYVGSTLDGLDGNTSGPGNMTLNHYLSIGWKVSDKWSLTVTQLLSQRIGRGVPEDTDRANFYTPYVTAYNSSYYSNDSGFNLAGRIRYYIPTSRSVRQKNDTGIGSNTDMGYGRLHTAFYPSQKFADGSLTFTGSTYLYYRLYQEGPEDVYDYRFIFAPNISYELNSTFSPFFELSIDGRHQKNGQWSNIAASQTIEFGTDISIGKQVTLTPYLDLFPAKKFKEGQLGFLASVVFL